MTRERSASERDRERAGVARAAGLRVAGLRAAGFRAFFLRDGGSEREGIGPQGYRVLPRLHSRAGPYCRKVHIW
ncbi:MAG: hypothetical protein ACXVES_13250, partial [Actinomycetota bacterium]